MKKKVLIMMVAFCVFSLQLQAQIQKKAPRWTKEILSPSEIKMIEDFTKEYDEIEWNQLKSIAWNRDKINKMLERIKSEKLPSPWAKYNGKKPKGNFSSRTMLPVGIYHTIQPIYSCKGDTSKAVFIAHSQLDNYDAHVKIELTYVEHEDSAEVIDYTCKGFSLSGAPVSYRPHSGIKLNKSDSPSNYYKHPTTLSPQKTPDDFGDIKKLGIQNGHYVLQGILHGVLTYRAEDFKERSDEVLDNVLLELP